MAKPIADENADYEAWLATQCDVVAADLDAKHARMRKDAFSFLRATYFRWARLMPELLPALMSAPQVLAVGDLHLENFGTWRDGESRLVWGVNDFDEAALMPYAFDLVRLVTSVQLAPGLAVDKAEAAGAILTGYRNGLAEPRPTLLDERETWLRPFVTVSDKKRRRFWEEIDALADATPPDGVADSLLASLPMGARLARYAARTKGGGSLGRPRFLAIASWRGGRIVREAKALVPSAWNWANGDMPPMHPFEALARGPSRAFDPFLTVSGRFVIRRIAADSRKADLGDAPESAVTSALLAAMGADLGAIHAAAPARAAAIAADLDARRPGWLHTSAKKAEAEVTADYEAWVAT